MPYSPDFDFEQLMRRLLVDQLRSFEFTSAQVNNNPQFARFLVQYNSYQQYIRDIGSTPDSIPYVDLLIGFELLIKQQTILQQLGDADNSLPVAVGLIKQLIARIDKPISETLAAEVNKVLDKLEEYENGLKTLYSRELKDGLVGLKDSNDRIGNLHRVLIGDPSDIPAIQKIVNSARDDIKSSVKDVETKFKAHIDGVVKEFDKKSKEYKDEIIETVCEEIPNRVVGESYYRYNATSQFYPTLVLVFVEKTEKKYPRRSQMKVKIKKETEEITESFITNLKNQFQIIQRKQYKYGALRACYVSSDKTYKNTIFCSGLDQAVHVFQNVYRIVGLDFDQANLSITSGRNRKPVTRRQRPLDGQVPEIQNYNEEFEVSLYRVVLQINGLPKPILIYKNYALN